MTIAIFKKPNGIKRIAAAVLAAATLISLDADALLPEPHPRKA